MTRFRLLALAALLWPLTLSAQSPVGLSPAVAAMWSNADAVAERGDREGAARLYERLFEFTGRSEALLRGAEMLEGEDPGRALALLKRGGVDRDLLVRRSIVALKIDDRQEYAEATDDLVGYGDDPGVAPLLAIRVADSDPERAAELFLSWLEGVEAAGEVGAIAAQVISDQVENEGDESLASLILERALDEIPESQTQLAAALEALEVTRLAERLSSASPIPLDEAGLNEMRSIRKLQREGEHSAGLARLQALSVRYPQSSEVHGVYATALAEYGDIATAERHYLIAEALAPMDVRWSLGLARLLRDRYAGRRNDEAYFAFGRALSADHTDQVILREQAEVALSLAVAGDPIWIGRAERVREHLNGAAAVEVDRLFTDVNRKVGPVEAVPLGQAPCQKHRNEDACRTYYMAEALWQRSRQREDVDQRRAALERAVRYAQDASKREPTWVKPLNLWAHILRYRAESEVGQVEALGAESESIYRRSLDVDPAQPAIWVHLGTLREREGKPEEAIQDWSRAAAMAGPGAAKANLFLAERAWEGWDLPGTRGHLEAVSQLGVSDPSMDARAERLWRLVRNAEYAVLAIVLTVLLGLATAMSMSIVRRRRTKTVRAWLDADPMAWREVASVSSALRHEVLKHNTSVLGVIADSLERGEVELRDWFLARMFELNGPIARGRGYMEKLQAAARRNGVFLDLRTKDPTFSMVNEGFSLLEKAGRALERNPAVGIAQLRRAAAILNEGAYVELGGLIADLHVVDISESRIRSVWVDVCEEPGIRERATRLDLVIEVGGVPPRVRIWQEDLDLIVRNLLRNAIGASPGNSADFLVRVDVEIDEITWMESVVVRVCDRAPKALSTQMIRSRYIDRGLGLTVDVISRNGGSVKVEPEPGWSKAVVVRLPAVE